MIRVVDQPLPKATAQALRAWQAEVDRDRVPFRAHVRAAEEAFALRRAQGAFAPVCVALRAMCSGVNRCMYCQDSGGVDVEHFQPKAWYPGLVFAWANFLLVCARCNRKKGSRFFLFHPKPTDERALVRARGSAPRRPPQAAPVLLNPRVDDPAAHLTLDLSGTLLFAPLGAVGAAPRLRAERTIEVLGLNDDDLGRSRRCAFEAFTSHLQRAGAAHARGDVAELARVREAVATTPCSVVWREMQRQRGAHPGLHSAFAAVPEAVGW